MVDPTKGVGPIQNIVSKSQANDKKPVDAVAESSAPVDQVEISSDAVEALSVSQAQQAAVDIRNELQKDLDRVLGIDPSFAEQVGQGEAPSERV